MNPPPPIRYALERAPVPEAEARLRPEDIAALYDAHRAGLGRFLFGVLRDAELVADALQQAFAIALEKGHQCDPDHRKGWLYRVAFHAALEIRARHGRAAPVSFTWPEPVDPAASPEQRAIQAERLDRLRELIGGLPPHEREVLLLRVTDGLTFAQIAARLRCPLGTALSRAHTALSRLKARMT